MKIAAQLYTVRDFLKTPADIAASLQRVKDIGYNAIQVSGLGPIDPQTLRQMANDCGLAICATHVPYIQLQSDIKTVIETHHMWDCQYVGIGSMPDLYRGSREGLVAFAHEASVYGRELAQEGLKLIYHNHNFEFAKFGADSGMDILLQTFDPAAIDFELDVYWVQAGGADPVQWTRKVDGRMKVVHLKDMAINQAREQMFAEVGEGNMNWPGIIQACDDIGVTWGAVEQDLCLGDPFDSLRISLHHLRSMAVEI